MQRMKSVMSSPKLSTFLFFNDTATTEIYTLSLHDALPIYFLSFSANSGDLISAEPEHRGTIDRKSTRLNSSHLVISYAGFCLKKNNKHTRTKGSGRCDHFRDDGGLRGTAR